MEFNDKNHIKLKDIEGVYKIENVISSRSSDSCTIELKNENGLELIIETRVSDSGSRAGPEEKLFQYISFEIRGEHINNTTGFMNNKLWESVDLLRTTDKDYIQIKFK